MPRLTITTPDGLPAAKGVYPLKDARLFNIGVNRHFVPSGSCLITPHDIVPDSWILPPGLWLSPDGSLANILHPYLNEPVAHEECDCHTNQSIRLAPGEWSEIIESDEDGETWIGLVEVDASGRYPIGAACGRDEKEAGFRLTKMCDSYIKWHWRRRSESWRNQHLCVRHLPAQEWLAKSKDRAG